MNLVAHSLAMALTNISVAITANDKVISNITKMASDVVKVLHFSNQPSALGFVEAFLFCGVVNEDVVHWQLHVGQV